MKKHLFRPTVEDARSAIESYHSMKTYLTSKHARRRPSTGICTRCTSMLI